MHSGAVSGISGVFAGRLNAAPAGTDTGMALERKGRGCAPPDRKRKPWPSGGVLDTAPVLRVFPKNSRFRLNQNGCAQISGVMSAADFLKYYVETTMQGGVHIVGPMPVPASFSQVTERLRAQFDQNDSRLPPMPQMKHTADTAALRVQVVNGSFVLEERLWAAARTVE
jgi:hypothetical protein